MPPANWDEIQENPLARDCLVPMGITAENVAERYGISTEEYDERKDIPLSERTILSRGEFVGLQQTLKARLRTALHAQEEARLPSYRLKAKVAQHLDTSAAENWGPACALSCSLRRDRLADVAWLPG